MRRCDNKYNFLVVAIFLSFASHNTTSTTSSSDDQDKLFNVFRKKLPLGKCCIYYHLVRSRKAFCCFREEVCRVHRERETGDAGRDEEDVPARV